MPRPGKRKTMNLALYVVPLPGGVAAIEHVDPFHGRSMTWAWQCPQCQRNTWHATGERLEEIAADALCNYCREALGDPRVRRLR